MALAGDVEAEPAAMDEVVGYCITELDCCVLEEVACWLVVIGVGAVVASTATTICGSKNPAKLVRLNNDIIKQATSKSDITNAVVGGGGGCDNKDDESLDVFVRVLVFVLVRVLVRGLEVVVLEYLCMVMMVGCAVASSGLCSGSRSGFGFCSSS